MLACWDWKIIRFELLNALNTLAVHDIFFIEREENIVSISIIAENLEHIRPLTRMKIIDNLIEQRAPALYRQYLFCYEVWDKKDWTKLPASRFFHRI